MSNFWKNWMTAWAIGVAIFGLLLAGTAFPATDGFTRALLSLFGNPMPDVLDAHHRFGFGLMGAVSMGWGLTIFTALKAIHAIEPAAAAPLWRGLTAGLLVWYVIDSAISIGTGFAMNAVSNTLLIALFLLPVLASGVLTKRG